MGMAQKILAQARERLNEIKTERQADVAAMKLGKKKARAEYRKTSVEEMTKKAKIEASKDVKAGGRFKRKFKEGLSAISTAKAGKGEYKFKSTKTKGKSQGDYARERMTIGSGKNPFQLGK